MTQQELDIVVAEHKKWVRSGGTAIAAPLTGPSKQAAQTFGQALKK